MPHPPRRIEGSAAGASEQGEQPAGAGLRVRADGDQHGGQSLQGGGFRYTGGKAQRGDAGGGSVRRNGGIKL